jgi:predicted AAA+ superfamily ATPase
LRDEDRGQLLEHLVLGEIAARFGVSRLHYWRDKQQHEVDFVLEVARRRDVLAIECKSAARKLDPASLMAFRRRHPGGRNLVVTLRDTDEYKRSFGEIEVEFVPYLKLPRLLDKLRGTEG